IRHRLPGWLFVWENGQRPYPDTVTDRFKPNRRLGWRAPNPVQQADHPKPVDQELYYRAYYDYT
ncbi:MAG: hypothetical protein ACRDTG_08605, partial [Pseudonocardiaceae bacterium]